MNLAQAIAVFAWELYRAAGSPGQAVGRDLASAEALERFHAAAREVLIEIGFLDGKSPDRIYADLRALAARAMIDERELAILMGVVRQVRWAAGLR
jgi:tRNA/rRNA methyltransferase